MPFAPKRICPRCRCTKPCACGRPADRGKTSDRGYGWSWQQTRDAFLRDPANVLCRDCLPKIELATQVHHIRKVATYPELRLVWENLMPLCDTHHAARSARGE